MAGAVADRSFRCSHASEAVGEPLLGTASTITNWLLVEHPSPWGEEPLRQARLPAGVGDVLLQRERELKIRVLLIRRPGRRTSPMRACFVIHTGPDRPWMERTDLEDVRDVATIDLGGLRRGGSVGLTASRGSLFAICTHGRRDPCCAERGRPLASALSKTFPDETWESTHIGGDRFAANMVAFPHGFYFGRVGPDEGADIAAAYVAGTLEIEHFRGRSCRPIDVQAAERYLRARDALFGIDDVTVVDVSRAGPQTSTTFRTPMGLRKVEIHRALGPEERLTCHSDALKRPPAFVLRGIETA